MGKALKVPLEQTRFAGKSNWVRCDVVFAGWFETSLQRPRRFGFASPVCFSAGRRADFGAFPVGVRPNSGPEG
jgi:hypothetical protein